MKNTFQLIVTCLAMLTLVNCGGGGSISTSSTSDAFDEGNLGFNPKMDILFVVDPSKSMFEEVEKVRNNISVFIESFIALGYEYRVGVISSSAWSAYAYEADSNLTFLARGGDPVFGNLHKGECVDRSGAASQEEYLDFLNASSVGTFLTKFSKNFDVYGVQKNTSGCGLVGPPFGTYAQVTNNLFENSNGYNATTRQQAWEYINDERPLQSVQAFLERDATKSGASKFVRDGAHLAIIIVSDEPDASRDSLTPSLTFVPGAAGNHDAERYINYLTTLKDDPSTAVNDGLANFSVYSIVDTAITSNIANDVASLSGGLSFDINATQNEYISNLNQISQAILISSSFFPIKYKPIPSTIEIQIFKGDGSIVSVPGSGFTYLPVQQGITLAAEYLPAIDDTLKINYVPAVLISGVSETPRISLSGNSVPEDTANAATVGTVSLLFGNSTDGIFTINQGASTPQNAYAIDAATGVITVADNALFDTEILAKHQIAVTLTLPDSSVFNQSFLISILDRPDSTPVAANDSYAVSETIAEANNIRVVGNTTFNDSGIDSSEAHSWVVVANVTPSTGSPNLVLNSNGTFTLNITDAASLGLSSGASINYTFTYRIVGTPATEVSNTATVTVTVEGFNQSPVLVTAIPDQSVSFSGGLIKIPIVAGDVTASGFASGNAGNVTDGAAGTKATTSASATGAHWIQMNFPASTIWEVDRFEIDGDHSLGNSVLQVRSATNQVITREALPVTLGSDLTVNMTQKVIGGSVRVLRSAGAKNSANDQDLKLSDISVYGIEAQAFTINLSTYFDDPDGDTITYYLTDPYGEGPAPGWVSVAGSVLTGIPPSGANTNIGVIAEDPSGATAFTVFNITRTGAGAGASNAPPIAVLPLDDEKRGGVTMKRFGGGSGNSNPQLDNQIRWGEIDNFFVNPYDGQAIRDAFTNSGLCTNGTGTCNLTATGYRTNPASIPGAIAALMPPAQLIHFGDNYNVENGWDIAPVYIDQKFPNGGATAGFCNQSAFLTAGNGGRVTPCINPTRSYGETYTGYFVPSQTGIFRFRTRRIDDNIRLFIAPTEYVEDLTPVVTVSYCSGSMVTMTQSIAPGLNTSSTCRSEFRGVPGGSTGGPNGSAVGAPTQIFYEGTTASYKNGYSLLKQGNVYALELRFAEGGGQVAFEFEYDRKDQSCDSSTNSPTSGCWDGFRPLDASVLVPFEGSDAHDPQVIDAPSNVVNLDVKNLYYDAEQDVLDYTARLVNPDGTAYLSGQIAEVGLTLNAQNGLLTGTLNAGYAAASPKPRIVFTATERFTAAQSATSSLPIKFDPN